ncbi:MAG: hypothetical protein P9L99_21695 [Candidatus Lernaella stagnicola]|nr:hypothetical protein [Candidatus Lernaella stagnicola]
MKRCYAIGVLILFLVGCASSHGIGLTLLDARSGEQPMVVDHEGPAAVTRDAELRLTLLPGRSALLLTVQAVGESEIWIDWDACRFVWPDGHAEAVLGSAPGLGAGDVGLRTPTRLRRGVPHALVLTPQSRAGRRLVDRSAGPPSPDAVYQLELALRVGDRERRYTLRFTLSS